MKYASPRNLRRAAAAQPFARARRPRPLGVSLARYTSIAAICGALLAGASAPAAVVYLDANGPTAGSGIVGGSTILWDASALIWNDLPGTGTPGFWVSGDTAFFAAGTDAGNPFTVTVGGAQSIGGLTFQLGGVTLGGAGSLLIAGNANFDVAANLTATVNTVIDGPSDLTKTGAGTLVLGGANTYTGRTLINAGTLSISSDGNLGAVPASTTDSISFTGSSTLQFTGAVQTLNANRGLTIGNTFTGTVQVVSAASSLTYGGLITGAAGTTFKKTGAGTLELQGASGLAGALIVDGGTLKLGGAGTLVSTSGVTIGNRGTLTLDNSVTNLGDRTAGALTSGGGTINFIGNAAATTETLGALTLNPGALTINTAPGAGASILTIPTLTRSVAGGTLFLNGTGLGTAGNQVVLSTAPALVNSILRYAVVSDGTLTSFANYTTSAGTNQSIVPLALAAHNQGAETTWVAASNARPTADTAMAANRLAYTLTLDSGIDLLVSTADRSLTLSGAVLQTGGVSVVGTAGGTIDNILIWGANEAIFHVLGSLQLNRGDATATLTGTGGFTKSGAGTLILNGVSTLSGAMNANEGLLELRGGTSLMTTAAALNLNGANLRLTQVAGTGTATTYTGNLVINADSTITVSRVDNPGTAITQTMGTLSIGGGRTLSVNSLNLTAGTAYALSLGAGTLTGPATFDVANNGAGQGTLTVSTLTGAFPVTKTGAGDLMLAGVYPSVVDIQAGRVGWNPSSGTVTEASLFSGAGGLHKNGAGQVNLTAANTFAGGVTVTLGTLGFSTVNNSNGSPSNLGMGTNGLTLNGGALSFIGSLSQSTNRAVALTASSTLDASGTGGATITYTGPITAGTDFSLNLTGTGVGNITGGITQPAGTAVADLNVNSGTWNLSGTPISIADDVIITGSTAVLNLNSTGVLTGTGASNGLYLRTGAIANLGANDVTGVANSGGNDFFLLGDTGVGALNMGAFNVTTLRLDIGDDDTTIDSANITGTGTLTVTADFNLYRGSIAANLAGAATIQKFGTGDVTLSGDNSGLTTAAGTTEIDGGNLILDYAASNATKISATNQLDMRGGVLTINGNASADTTQNVTGFTLANGGSNVIAVNRGGTQAATLNLGAITRTAGTGTIRFIPPASGAITTTTANAGTTGMLGGWATITDATGTYFAKNDGANNIVAVLPTTKNDVSTWAAGDNLTDGVDGFSGALGATTPVNSLRFNSIASTVTIADGQALGLNGAGVLQTSSVAGESLITGGKLESGLSSELIFTTDSIAQRLTVASNIVGNESITKTGNGTLRLSGTNNFTGAARLQVGTLQVTGGNAIGDTAPVTIGATQNSLFELLSNETIGTLSGGVNANLVLSEIRLNGNTLTLNQAATGTYSGLLTGDASSSFVKNGALFFQFTTSSNTYAGTVTINTGPFYLSASTTLPNVPAYTINKGASFIIDGNGTTTSGARIADTATITLNSADGNLNGDTRPSGLTVRRDQGSGYTETVGVVTLSSGANYARLDGTVTNAVATIVTDNIVRSNRSTLAVRGTNLSNITAARGQLRIGTAGNQTAFIAAMVGGGSTTLGTKNISIVPWAISEEYTAGLGDANMGNSFATYVSANGFRALNFATEYSTFAAKLTNQDNVRETLAASLTGVAGQTVNALVLNNSNTVANSLNVTGAGAGQTLAVTSGGLLFTATAAVTGTPAMGITLGGFDAGITVGGPNEYVIFVQNPTVAAAGGLVTATVSSPLASTADITKSGRGTLVLTGVSLNAGGGVRRTTLNEGVLEISDLDNIGGNSGALVLAGGTLRLGTGFTDDLSSRAISFLLGGGTLDTNGLDVTLANSLGSGAGSFTKAGAGNLTLNAGATYTGNTTISLGTVTLGAAQAISTGTLTVNGGATLAIGANNLTIAGLTLSNAANVLSGTGSLFVAGDATVNRGTIAPLLTGNMNLLKLTASQTVTLSNTANSFTGYTHVQDGTLSIASMANAGVASSLGAPTGDNAAIRLGNLTTAGTLAYTGGAASTNRMIVLPGTTGGGTIDNDGTGALTLAGNLTGTEYGAKALTLQGATTGFTNVVSGLISDGLGTLALTKAEAGTWSLTASNTFTGATTISTGVLHLGNGNALQNSAVTVTASNGLIFAGGIGTFNMASIAGAGNLALTDLAAAPVAVVAGSNNTSTTYSGAISGNGALVKLGTGTLTLSSTTNSFSGGLKVRAGTVSATGNSGSYGSGTITLGDPVSNPANVALTGFLSNGNITNSIVLESGTTGTITLATTNASTPYTYSGPVTGPNHLTVAANASQPLTFSNLINNGGTITNAGTGTGTTTISGGVGSNVTGIIQNSANSAFVLSGPNSYKGATTVTAGTLSVTGALNTSNLMTGITVKGGATLNLVNGSGTPLSALTTLSLGTGTGTTTLGLELGSTSDLLTVTGTASTANNVTFNLTGLPGFSAGNYDLLTATGGGLGGATYSLGNILPGGFSYSFANSTDFVVRLTATAVSGNFYWRGGFDGNWSLFSGGLTNWTTDLAGNANALATPGALNTVIFSSTAAIGPALSTTLNGNFAVNDLKFTSNPTGVTSVTIAAGTPATSSLTIAPSSSTAGIDVADNAGAIAVSAPVVLGANQTWTVSNTNASLAVSGGITGSGVVTKAGAGTLTLSGTNTHNGGTTVSDGVLLAGAANAFSPNSSYTVNGTAILRLNGLNNVIGSLAGSGTVQNNHATTAATLTTGSDNTNTTFSGVLQNGAAANLSLTKTGTGKLTLAGANTHTGTTSVNGGTLQIGDGISGSLTTGSSNIISGGAAGSGVLNVVSGDSTTNALQAGNAASSFGALNFSGGTLAATVDSDSVPAVGLGTANGGYGYLNISGGIINARRFYVGGTSATSGTGGVGVGLITGGTVNVTNASNNYIIVARHGASTGVLTITGGTINHNTGNQNFNLGWQGTGRAELNVAGGLIDNTTKSITFGGGTWTGTGILNLNAGTLLTNNLAHGSGTSYVNFNGGTLKASAATTTFVPVGVTAAFVFGAFGTFAGGAVIDTNGFNDTIPAALLAPAGDGVASLTLATQGSGYIGAPYVSISGTGTGATAIANMVDDGTGNGTLKIASLTITNPGVNYTGTPTFTLTGAGASTAATAGAVTTAPNTSGGLTKNGAGNLTLTGANTYTGVTTVNAGTLILGGNNVLADASGVTVNGGVFDINTRTETVGAFTLQSGSITGTTGVLTASSYNVQSGTAAAILGGAASLTKTTAGTVTLSAVNTFSGSVNVNGGTLAFSTNAHLGNSSATNTINFGGGALSYTGAGALDLGANRVLTLGAGGGTLDVSAATATLTVSGGVSPASTGNLVKSGAGSLILPGATNLNGGTATVSGGFLQAAFGTSGASGISVAAGATLHNITPSASMLVLPGTGSLTLTAGATLATASNLGFGLNATSAAGITLSSGGALTINGSGTVFLDVLSLGGPISPTTYNLLSVPGGGLLTGTSGAVDYALDDVIGGYTYTLNRTSTLISVTVGLFSGSVYWHGDLTGPAGSWSDYRSGDTNWKNAATGGIDDGILPGAQTTVIFSATEATGPAISTTLDGDVSIKHLQFTSNPPGVTAVNIAPGTGGVLTIAPAASTDGIDIGDNAGAITISAPLVAGAAQTWNVSGTGAALIVSGGLTGSGSITKAGAGALTISAASSTMGSNIIWNGGGLTLTPTGTSFTVNGAISGSGSGPLVKNGTGTLVLNGANTFTGGMTIDGGTTILGNKQALGAGTVNTVTNAPILQASVDLSGANKVANAFVLDTNLTVSGANNLEIGGTTTISTNNRTITNSLTGGTVLTLSGNVILGETGTARNLTVAGAGATVINGMVQNGPTGGGWLVKGTGAGSLTLGAPNTYTGFTIVDQGTMILAPGVNQSMTNTFYFGSSAGATTAGTLDLSNASATFTVSGTNLALWNQINSTTATPAIIIGAGQSLNLNGNVLIGNNGAVSTATLMTASGAGTINVTNNTASAAFRVGGYSTATQGFGNKAIADLGGLANFNVSLNTSTGTFAVSNSSSGNTTDKYAVLTLAATTNITAKTLAIGDGGQYNATAGQVNALKLGSAVTSIKVDTINIGTGQRDLGSFTFNTGSGTLFVNNAAGTGRAVLNIGTTGGATGVLTGANVNTFDVTGHTATLMLGAVTIGSQNRGDAVVSNFSFNQGTLDMTSLTLSNRGATAQVAPSVPLTEHSTTSTVNLGGGNVTIGSGILQMAQATAAAGAAGSPNAVTATINISGGTVNIGATTGTSITMASAVASTSATATLSLTGGTTTLTGNIVKGGGAGTSSATVTLNGGTLDMGGKAIGSAANPITFNAQKGTLSNLAELNGGGGLTKSGPDTLALTGNNTYTGGTNVSAGTLQIGNGGADGNLGSGPITTGTNATLAVKRSNTMTIPTAIGGTGNFAQTGSGTTILTGANDYSGSTTISSGTLQIGAGASGSLGAGLVINNANLDFRRTDAAAVAAAIGGSGTVTQSGGALTLDGAVTGQNLHVITGSVTLGAGNSSGTVLNHILPLLTIDDGASARIASTVNLTLNGPKVVQVSSLAIPAGSGHSAFLDLTNNALIFDYAGTVDVPAQVDPLQAGSIASLLKSGFSDGSWDGAGIRTSSVTDALNSNPAAYQYLTGIGYVAGKMLADQSSHMGSFYGRSFDEGSVVVRYTFYGDTDLDGVVGGGDYGPLDSAYAALHDSNPDNNPVINWQNGDFDYSGSIDGADYALIDTAVAFSTNMPLASSFIEMREEQFGAAYTDKLASLPTAVPEPAGIGLLMVGAAMLGLRRRRAPAPK